MDYRKFSKKYEDALKEIAQDENVERTELAYNHAVDFVEVTKQVSISKVQRALRIGYNHASRIVQRMEDSGIVSKANHDGSRTVLSVCFANKGDSEENMQADSAIDYAMELIDAEDEDHADVRGVVARMIAAGYTKTETCDPVGYDN